MKILFVADLHYALKQFDWLESNAGGFDLVVIGGDLLDLAGALDLDVQIVVVEKYLRRLRQMTKVVVSSGNHDGDGRNEDQESVSRWILAAKAPQLYVDSDCVELADTLVTVCPWWDGPVSRGKLESILARDAEKTKTKWIWVHHAPPDRSPVSWTGKKFAGDEYLTHWIGRYRPDLVLSGHIHNAPFYPAGSWMDRIGNTWVFNPGKQPGPRPTCLVLDLAAMTVDWISVEREDSRRLEPLDPPKTTAGFDAVVGG